MEKQRKIQLIVALVSLLLTVYLGYDLRSLYNQNELWGHRVLGFWVLFWISFLALVAPKMSQSPQKNRLLLASCISGVLLSSGFMPMPTFFLMFVGFIPLLWAEDVLSKEREETAKWEVFKLSFNAFFIWNILSTWWIQNSSFPAGIFGNALNAVFMTIPFLFYHVTKKSMNQRAANLGFISYWMTFEIGHLTWDLSWPWLTLGNSFAHMPILVQWYEFTGVFGGSLWILGINIWLFNGLFALEEETKGKFQLLLKPLLAFAFPILISIGMYYMQNVEIGEKAEVVTVQPNYEPHYQKFTIPQQQQFAQFMRLAEEKVTDNTAYVVFPETSFRGINAKNLEAEGVIQGLQSFVERYANLNLVIGLSAAIQYEEGEKHPKHVYTYCNADKTFCQYLDIHNAAIQLNNQATTIPYYKKSKLVPGAESMPFIGDLDLFKGLILDLGGAPGVSLGTQIERDVFSSKQGKVAPLICYESVYGDYVTGYTKKGAEAFFVITNDGWWDNTAGHRQHMYLASLRAIENRRYVVRSANTGVSCFINSRGDIYNPSQYDEPIAIRDEIYLRDDLTFYSQYGDLIGRVSILVSIWILVSMVSNGLRERK